jgi:Cu/Ag efflux protein CusF
MLKRYGPALLICLLAATAQAQSPDGHGHGGRGGRPQGAPDAPRSGGAGPASNPTPVEQVSIVGVVQAIDPAAGRITIAYDAVDARNWPPGVMPFVVNKPALLDGVTVGEKVRFKLESEQITELAPFTPGPGEPAASQTRPPSGRGAF